MELNAVCACRVARSSWTKPVLRGRRKGIRGRAAGGNVPVVGIMERDGRFHVSVVPAVSTATLLKFTVKKVRRGRIVV